MIAEKTSQILCVCSHPRVHSPQSRQDGKPGPRSSQNKISTTRRRAVGSCNLHSNGQDLPTTHWSRESQVYEQSHQKYSYPNQTETISACTIPSLNQSRTRWAGVVAFIQTKACIEDFLKRGERFAPIDLPHDCGLFDKKEVQTCGH